MRVVLPVSRSQGAAARVGPSIVDESHGGPGEGRGENPGASIGGIEHSNPLPGPGDSFRFWLPDQSEQSLTLDRVAKGGFLGTHRLCGGMREPLHCVRVP